MQGTLRSLLAELEAVEAGPSSAHEALVDALAAHGLSALRPIVLGQLHLTHRGMHLSEAVVAAIRDPDAIPMLVSLITSPTIANVRYADAAQEALQQLGALAIPALTPATPWEYGLSAVCDVLSSTGDVRCVERLTVWLEHVAQAGDVTAARTITWALGRLGAVEALDAALSSPVAAVRVAALRALPVDRPDTRSRCAQMLTDPDASVRLCAVQVLIHQGDHTTTNALEACLQDEDRRVRRAAKNALGAQRARAAKARVQR